VLLQFHLTQLFGSLDGDAVVQDREDVALVVGEEGGTLADENADALVGCLTQIGVRVHHAPEDQVEHGRLHDVGQQIKAYMFDDVVDDEHC